MNHDLLKSVIYDQQEVIRSAEIVPRDYSLEPSANYVITGLRRAGKSTLLYALARDLVSSGLSWDQIAYLNFEDERLAEFTLSDFNDILLVQRGMSDGQGILFLDEVQNIPGWERFARRLADSKQRAYITGSNASMLSSQMEAALGGRYLSLEVSPYRFGEYVRAKGQASDERALHTTAELGRILALFDHYLREGGLPESLSYRVPRVYTQSVYQKVLLGDIAACGGVRNVQALRILMKKVAETVRNEVSISNLHGMLKAVGLSVGKDTVIDYLALARDAYLIFSVRNFYAKFAEREGKPKYYFSDNGILGLFLHDKDTALLENLVAAALHERYGEGLYFLRSARTGIDLDFYVPDEGLAVQVAYSIAGEARRRELGAMQKLVRSGAEVGRLIVVTREERETIPWEDGPDIQVIPAYEFLLALGADH